MNRLDPHDARVAYNEGVAIARLYAGAPVAWFMHALREQQAIIREGIRRSGYPARQARLVGDAYEAGARAEWKRIAGTAQPEARGSA